MNNIVIRIIGLSFFGALNVYFQKTILSKMITIDENKFLVLLEKINYVFSFLYPFFYYSFLVIIYNMIMVVFKNKKDVMINKILFYSMFPSFIFLAINTFYSIELLPAEIDQINNFERSIIPFLDYSLSSAIAELCFISPAFFLVFYFAKYYKFLDCLILSFSPILIFYLFYLLL